ncbi:MAG: arylsulfatase [Verrucomicrobiales bacterium]|nr:arylsulfatase [Verrucomicrobiales bacterium]
MSWRTLGVILLALLSPLARSASVPRPPNIILMVADDLGYGDLGCYGQKQIRTPNLDRVASQGIRFTRHYSGNAVCAPSRCVLMTGRHPGHAQIRDNREVQPEGQWPLSADTPTLPRLLKKLGYATGAFGKWGLGAPGSSGDPLNQGFDHFFGYNCQRQAHNHYPTYLWNDASRVPLNNPSFPAHQKLPADRPPDDPASYTTFQGLEYAPDRIAEAALSFVRQHREQPFFLFLPTTIPHLALQVPDDSVREYKDAMPDTPYLGNASYLPHRTPHAAYAAMITRMDREVGRLLALIAELGLDEQTLFIFTSDNGPLYDRLGGTDSEFFNSAAGLRGRKGSLHEGGVRVPCVVRWLGHIREGRVENRLCGFEDWLPTLLELAGGRQRIPPQLDGVSFAPTILGHRQSRRPLLYREFASYDGWQAAWDGDWKYVRRNLNPAKPKALSVMPEDALYRLDDDPGETSDLSSRYPRRVSRFLRQMNEEHTASAEFPMPALDHASR